MKPRIFISAGHSLSDSGAQSGGYEESDIVIKIRDKVKTLTKKPKGDFLMLIGKKYVWMTRAEMSGYAKAGPGELLPSNIQYYEDLNCWLILVQDFFAPVCPLALAMGKLHEGYSVVTTSKENVDYFSGLFR